MATHAATDVHIPSLAARTLACAVIKQAMVDALDPTADPQIRADAEQFLAGDHSYGRHRGHAAPGSPAYPLTLAGRVGVC
jgi:hypothetical protein